VTDEIRNDWSPVSLLDKEIVGKVADIDGIDILGIDPLVNGAQHLQVGLREEVLGIAILEQSQFRQTTAYNRYAARKFSFLPHNNLLIRI
jgi:hypothetical protein